MNLYFISGLGANRKAFERIKLPAHFSIHHLDWIAPQKQESLNAYARRLAAAIDKTQPFALVGLSMGGMIAVAMTQFLQPQKVILISSVASAKEFPPLFRLARFTKAYKLIPVFLLRSSNPVIYWLFGARTKKQKAILDLIISNTSPRFVKWAIGAILNWDRKRRPQNIFQIHGEKDKILPVHYTRPDVVVKNGSHLMVWTRAGEVSRIMKQVLET